MPPTTTTTTTTANRVLILGLGYTGTGLANRIADRHPDWTVTGTVRSAPRTPARYPLHRRVETVAYDDIVERVTDRATRLGVGIVAAGRQRRLRLVLGLRVRHRAHGVFP